MFSHICQHRRVFICPKLVPDYEWPINWSCRQVWVESWQRQKYLINIWFLLFSSETLRWPVLASSPLDGTNVFFELTQSAGGPDRDWKTPMTKQPGALLWRICTLHFISRNQDMESMSTSLCEPILARFWLSEEFHIWTEQNEQGSTQSGE